MASARLASDLDNPDYTGATNPDSRLAVMFYSKPIENEFQSMAQGRPIFEDRDFVRIFVPGDPTTVVDTFVREDHKARFPLHWAHYQNKHGGDSKEIGTPLSHWPRLQPSQVEELRALKFYTVEAVAGAADAQLQRIGMVAGMSPYAFRDAAVRFLALAKDDSKAAEVEARAKALEEENKKLREDSEKAMAEMRAEMQALKDAFIAKETPKGKPGRPKKDELKPEDFNSGTL
jgi:hypothetical protein